MKKNILIYFILFGIFFSAWNTPYIDTDETLQLKYGISKDAVLDKLGTPLYVQKGWPNGSENELVWVYEVRTINVRSKTAANGSIEIVKVSSSTRPADKHHRLKLTFEDNKLINWEPIKEEVVETLINIEELPKVSKKRNFFIYPKLSRVSESVSYESTEYVYDWDYYEGSSSYETTTVGSDSNSGFRFGVVIEKPLAFMNVGLDISIGSGGGAMFFISKSFSGFHGVLSFGADAYSHETSNTNTSGTIDVKGSLKLGVFKDFNKFSFGIERMSRSDVNESESMYGTSVTDASATFLTLKYRLGK